MTADILLCWYAMGYVACGANCAFIPKPIRMPWPLCLLLPHALFALLCGIIAGRLLNCLPRIDTSKQYLWRRHE